MYTFLSVVKLQAKILVNGHMSKLCIWQHLIGGTSLPKLPLLHGFWACQPGSKTYNKPKNRGPALISPPKKALLCSLLAIKTDGARLYDPSGKYFLQFGI
jgi:hypothetical protein